LATASAPYHDVIGRMVDHIDKNDRLVTVNDLRSDLILKDTKRATGTLHGRNPHVTTFTRELLRSRTVPSPADVIVKSCHFLSEKLGPALHELRAAYRAKNHPKAQ